MSKNHIAFEKMSDLYDNDISTKEETDSILEHIESCEYCKTDYSRLRKTVKYLSYIKHIDYNLSHLPSKTTSKIIKSRRKKTLRKVLYPVAATVLIIFGISMLNTYVVDSPDSYKTRNGITGIKNNNLANISETEKIVKIIGNFNARVVKVAGRYVEGEILYEDFWNLRRTLGFNGFQKIRFSVFDNSKIAVSNGQSYKNIENVGAGNKLVKKQKPANKKRFIHFKIFL